MMGIADRLGPHSVVVQTSNIYLQDGVQSVKNNNQVCSRGSKLNANHPNHGEKFSLPACAISHELLVGTRHGATNNEPRQKSFLHCTTGT